VLIFANTQQVVDQVIPHPLVMIAGFGLFSRFAILPAWRAWEVFEEGNGAVNQFEMIRRLARLTGGSDELNADRPMGCIAVAEPVFFEPDAWVAPPDDMRRQIVSGKSYDLTVGEGRRIYEECLDRAGPPAQSAEWAEPLLEAQRRGKPQLIQPRLGQGSFRLAVLDAYGDACAVTTEHALPVLEAAHIRPWAIGGRHVVPNGLPLRRDLHRLFDLGFVTVGPDLKFRVSDALDQDYANGREYYAMAGRKIMVPDSMEKQPDRDQLAWHAESIFRG
jgi:putative restriction endonuclease